jgi:AcrR family transcriptional regulator
MPRTGLDRVEQRNATRAKLIDSALQLFSTSGYEYATVDDIANAAGYSKGAYYFHFSTKDDILYELLRMWAEGRTATLAEIADSREIDAAGLRTTIESFFSYRQDPRWPGMLLEFWGQAVRNQDISKRLAEVYGAWRKKLSAAFEQAAARGELRVAAGDDAAAVVLAAHDGYVVQTAVGAGRTASAAELVEMIVGPLESAAAEPAAERRRAVR